MPISSKGLDLICEFEGFRPVAYLCAAGKPTIGFGHTRTVTMMDVGERRITRAKAIALLRSDVQVAESAVNRLGVPLKQHQFDALVSLVFNCGPAPLKGGVGKVLRSGQFDKVPVQIMRWTRAGGRVLKGLERRRRAECAMWRGLDNVEDGEDLAGLEVEPVPSKPLTKSLTMGGSVVAGTGALSLTADSLPQAVEVARHGRDLWETLWALATGPGFPVLVGLFIVGACVLIAYRRWADRDHL